jgi:hypothetical protein
VVFTGCARGAASGAKQGGGIRYRCAAAGVAHAGRRFRGGQGRGKRAFGDAGIHRSRRLRPACAQRHRGRCHPALRSRGRAGGTAPVVGRSPSCRWRAAPWQVSPR